MSGGIASSRSFARYGTGCKRVGCWSGHVLRRWRETLPPVRRSSSPPRIPRRRASPPPYPRSGSPRKSRRQLVRTGDACTCGLCALPPCGRRCRERLTRTVNQLRGRVLWRRMSPSCAAARRSGGPVPAMFVNGPHRGQPRRGVLPRRGQPRRGVLPRRGKWASLSCQGGVHVFELGRVPHLSEAPR